MFEIFSIPGGAVKSSFEEGYSEGILHEVSVGADDRRFANGDDEERSFRDRRQVPFVWHPHVPLGEGLATPFHDETSRRAGTYHVAEADSPQAGGQATVGGKQR